MQRSPVANGRDRSARAARWLGLALLAALSTLLPARQAEASSFSGRLALGPGYLHNDVRGGLDDSSGPALLTQLNLGLRLQPWLVVHGTVMYDYSNWLEVESLQKRWPGSMLGFGAGIELTFGGVCLDVVGGGQFTAFTSVDDPTTGTNGASLGPLFGVSAGYLWNVLEGTQLGVHGVARFRRSEDETLSIVYDPSGYQLGLVVSIGLEGSPLHGP